MPHVDEGTLHALLDGALRAGEPARAADVEAHLEVCEDCRARLEAAEELRGRATGILAALDVDAAPDFEEVRVRAGRAIAQGAVPALDPATEPADLDRRARLRRQARWTHGLAWAASFVIALGTGYLIRDQLAPEPTTRSDVPARQTVADGVARPSEPVGDESAAPRPATPTVESETERPALPRTSDRTRPQASADRDGGRERPPASETMAAVDAAGAPSAPAGEEADQLAEDLPVVSIADAERRMVESAGAASVAETELRIVESARAATGTVGPVRIRGRSSANAPAQAFLDDPPPFLTADEADGLVETTPEELGRGGGGPLLVLPGATVIRTLVGRGPGAPVIVSLQRLEDGVDVRVTQRPVEIALESLVVTGVPAAAAEARDSAAGADRPPAGAERPAAPAPAPAREEGDAVEPDSAWTRGGFNRAEVGHLGLRLILEAALPVEALEALGARALPYGTPR